MRYIILSLITIYTLLPATADACGMYISEELLVKEEILEQELPFVLATKESISTINSENISKLPSESLLNIFDEIDAITSPVTEKIPLPPVSEKVAIIPES